MRMTEYGESTAPENESRMNKFLRFPAAPVIVVAVVGALVVAVIKIIEL